MIAPPSNPPSPFCALFPSQAREATEAAEARVATAEAGREAAEAVATVSGIVLFRAGVRVPVLELRVTSGPPATPLLILYKTLVFKLKVMSDPAELVCPLTPRLKCLMDSLRSELTDVGVGESSVSVLSVGDYAVMDSSWFTNMGETIIGRAERIARKSSVPEAGSIGKDIGSEKFHSSVVFSGEPRARLSPASVCSGALTCVLRLCPSPRDTL